MLNLAKLFGKSPFAPLQNHLKKVSACIYKLPALFEAIEIQDMPKIEEISSKISELEHEADITKNDIRNHLPKSLFLPIDRYAFLEILSLQDSFADHAEDIGIIATLKTLENYQEMKALFAPFLLENIHSFDLLKNIVEEFDSLLEASFGGVEAQKVKDMIDEVAKKEYEVDCMQFSLLKKLYELPMAFTTFHQWTNIIIECSSLSNLAEKLANRIRMLLEIK